MSSQYKVSYQKVSNDIFYVDTLPKDKSFVYGKDSNGKNSDNAISDHKMSDDKDSDDNSDYHVQDDKAFDPKNV